MAEATLTQFDLTVRGTLANLIAEIGYAPDIGLLAARLNASKADAEASLLRLHDAHALLLHPHMCRPWAVHPFALAPASCWVQTANKGYWANCVYCAFGICAALKRDAVITTRYGGESETVRYEIKNGRAPRTGDVFHFSTPAARWWDNVIFACASFQPFRTETDAQAWCARHGMPRGAIMTIAELWAFAADWYGGHLQIPWRKRSTDEIRALFVCHGLTSGFWAI